MGKYKIWMGDDGIFRAALQGVHEKQDAESIIDGINDFSKERGQVRVLMDLSETERATVGARRAHIKNIKAEPSSFDKLAMFGASAMNRVMANFIIRASGREDKARYFETEEEALEWLKE